MDLPAPRRSPDAQRFDPPLRRLGWVVERRLSRAELLVEARARWGAGPGDFDRLLWHGGLHVNGRPLCLDDSPPAEIPARSRVVAWGFLHEPEPVRLPEEALLLDREGLVGVAKPAWLPTQGTRASQRHSLEAELRRRLGCPGLRAVHRLDRQTSGVVLFARDRATAAWLQRAAPAGLRAHGVSGVSWRMKRASSSAPVWTPKCRCRIFT